jgi:hypothetical protein
MPLNCPHCQIAQADGSETCLNCGGPLTPASDPGVAVHNRRDFWKRPVLLAAVTLFLLAGAVLLTALRKPVSIPAPPASPAPAALVSPSPVPAALSAVVKNDAPLIITLVSAAGNRPVKIGQAVRLTTFTDLAPGQSASLTLTYRWNHGKSTLFSFAQGSLASTTWTPFAPGRYDFLATALDDHQRAATARHLQIIVNPDSPPAIIPSKPLVAAAVPVSRASLPAPAPAYVPPLLPKPPPPRAAAKPSRRLVSSLLRFTVAAAHFPFNKNAVVLADALHRQGYHAVPEQMADGRGKAVYVVVTGSYFRPENARKQMLVLQRSGYPAYIFRSH